MIKKVEQFNIKQHALNEPEWQVRVGIHTGELISGVVVRKKFAYDVWVDTVNISSRMESNSVPNRLNISKNTFSYVKKYFEFEERGEIQAENRGKLEMYFINSLLPEFTEDAIKINASISFYEA